MKKATIQIRIEAHNGIDPTATHPKIAPVAARDTMAAMHKHNRATLKTPAKGKRSTNNSSWVLRIGLAWVSGMFIKLPWYKKVPTCEKDVNQAAE
jgi:hypothetical protein